MLHMSLYLFRISESFLGSFQVVLIVSGSTTLSPSLRSRLSLLYRVLLSGIYPYKSTQDATVHPTFSGSILSIGSRKYTSQSG
ncbi:uncharacterized protein EURHEDRAFT_78941 [Aspergillus ruber CBS 135680]|uniref:Uncharacterized protein n=1 Tax=Aspergillus ruber (strain CBS 135680) TaxID=1388766 RepID=A0A017SD95_ASPRC|nr:uncharacterized protein EURHEDRAFT_78941 [Aspergillus ruber CBS 135680]EYE94579.1 hypothetical protein EURHEDRAFT_78941 [Aspergillus ruber CBS 135680]